MQDCIALILFYSLLLAQITVDGPPAAEPREDAFGNIRPPVTSPAVKKPREPVRPAPQTAPPRKLERCPEGMTYIASGKFNKKSIEGFCLDTHEVTIASFERYLYALEQRAEVTQSRVKGLRSALKQILWPELDPAEVKVRNGHCTWLQVGKNPDLPLNCVSYAEAEAYCIAQGKRLPSEREWHWAARGGKRALPYPWGGGRPTNDRLNMAEADEVPKIVPVGAYDASPFGLHDMAGNLWEWTAGDPASTSCNARGGGFRSLYAHEVRVTSVLRATTRLSRSDEIGFRCAAPARAAERSP